MPGLLSRSTVPDDGCHRPKPGVYALFVDPDLAAPAVPVVWTRDSGVRVVAARAQASRVARAGDLDLVSPSPVVHICVDPAGNQYIVLSGPGLQVQLVITGVLVTSMPVTLAFETIGVSNLPHAQSAFGVLTQLLVKQALSERDDRPGPVERRELRDALIALDGKAFGASHREIAQVIYGTERVETEWGDTDSPLRQKIKRDLARGRRLMNGSYRDLLRRWQQGSLGPVA